MKRAAICQLGPIDQRRSLQARLDPSRLVFIDETWIKTSMAPLRGWGPKGKRLSTPGI